VLVCRWTYEVKATRVLRHLRVEAHSKRGPRTEGRRDVRPCRSRKVKIFLARVRNSHTTVFLSHGDDPSPGMSKHCGEPILLHEIASFGSGYQGSSASKATLPRIGLRVAAILPGSVVGRPVRIVADRLGGVVLTSFPRRSSYETSEPIRRRDARESDFEDNVRLHFEPLPLHATSCASNRT
jgi:hypothetical protein